MQMSRRPYHSYDRAALDSALRAVREEGMGQRSAAKTFGVPHTTIQDRLKGRVADGVMMGKKTVLTLQEESVLSDVIIRSAKAGFPLQRMDVRSWVKQILDLDGRETPFKDNLPGKYITLLKACNSHAHFQLCFVMVSFITVQTCSFCYQHRYTTHY